MHATLQAFPGAAISAFFVWLPMLPEDTAPAAAAAAHVYADRGEYHFYDPQRISGKAIAAALGGAGRVAWDAYLVYPRGARWDGAPPDPVAWSHQLTDSSWADAAHYRTGEALTAALHSVVERLISESAAPK